MATSSAGSAPCRAALTGVPLVLLTLVLSACSTSGERLSTPDEFDATRSAPSALEGAWAGTEVVEDEASAELLMDDGRTVVLWIDPEDTSRVLTQRSDTEDPDAWTAPTVLATAGDTCLMLLAATDGERIGGTLYCYESNGAIDQAPDQAYAVVSVDHGASWLRHEYLELTGTPTFTGDEIVWDQQLTWSEDGGFEDQS